MATTSRGLRLLSQGIADFWQTVTSALAFDKTLLILAALYTLWTLPTIFYGNKDARMLDTLANDDALISMQLDGMTIPPYGNPSNFLVYKNSEKIPPHWYDIRYYEIMYYGGLYLDFAYAIFGPLKALGIATFPAAPLILKFFAYLFGLLSIMTVYNFARQYFGWYAALTSAFILMVEEQFLYFTKRIHPDTLLLFLGLLGLHAAVKCSRYPSLQKVIGFGIIIGAMQGTKVGAPWMLPTAMLSIYFSYQEGALFSLNFKKLYAMGRDIFILGVVSIVAFFITTPYALFKSYYFSSMKRYYKLFTKTQSPLFDHVSFVSWVTDFYNYMGITFYFVAAAILYVFIKIFRTKGTRSIQIPLIVTLVLLFSNFLWYATKGVHWVQLFYLMPTFSLCGVCLGIMIQDGFNLLRKLPNITLRYIIKVSILLVGAYGLVLQNKNERCAFLDSYLIHTNYNSSLLFAVGKWIAKNIPPRSRIQHDGIYIDPALFPEQNMGCAVFQYDKILKYKPEYIVLTYRTFYHWISEKIKTQKFAQCDPSGYSVRLYQDLIPKDPALWKVGYTPIPHVKLIHIANKPPILPLFGASEQISSFDKNDIQNTTIIFIYKIDPGFYAEWERKCGIEKIKED